MHISWFKLIFFCCIFGEQVCYWTKRRCTDRKRKEKSSRDFGWHSCYNSFACTFNEWLFILFDFPDNKRQIKVIFGRRAVSFFAHSLNWRRNCIRPEIRFSLTVYCDAREAQETAIISKLIISIFQNEEREQNTTKKWSDDFFLWWFAWTFRERKNKQ